MANCLFCNDTVKTKTKEHVIPKWLLKLTNNVKGRKALLNREKWMPFDKYTFPACKTCNGKYSFLEEKAKEVFIKIFADISLNETELNILLDWFDKVRVGIWYGELIINNEIGIVPKFGIEDRMGKKDRILIISKTNNEEKGINLYGTTFSGFTTIPSYFGLRINNLFFLNMSDDFIVSKKVGLPFLGDFNKSDAKTGLTNFSPSQINSGTKSIDNRFVRYPFTKYSTIIAQPIVNYSLKDSGKYDNDYSNNIFLNRQLGTGNLFLKTFDSDMKMITSSKARVVPNKVVDFRHTLKKLTIVLAKYQKQAIIDTLSIIDKIEFEKDQKQKYLVNANYFIDECDRVINGSTIFMQDHSPLI